MSTLWTPAGESVVHCSCRRTSGARYASPRRMRRPSCWRGWPDRYLCRSRATSAVQKTRPLTVPAPWSRLSRCRRHTVGDIGGLARNRTGVQGFAVLCVTTPPRGLPSVPRCDADGRNNHKPRRAATAKHYAQAHRRLSVMDRRKGLRPPDGVAIRRPPIPDSSAVEQSTVNRLVAGSNPAPGATFFRGLSANRSGPFSWARTLRVHGPPACFLLPQRDGWRGR